MEGQSGYLGNANCVPEDFEKMTEDMTGFTYGDIFFFFFFLRPLNYIDKYCSSVSLRAIFTSAAIQKKFNSKSSPSAEVQVRNKKNNKLNN